MVPSSRHVAAARTRACGPERGFLQVWPVPRVAGLARTLGRDYKRVHEDVSALVHAGLLVRDEHGIRAPYDSVQAIVSLDA